MTFLLIKTCYIFSQRTYSNIQVSLKINVTILLRWTHLGSQQFCHWSGYKTPPCIHHILSPGLPSCRNNLRAPANSIKDLLDCPYTDVSCNYNLDVQKTDAPQFRGGNPYFFSENLYQSISFIYSSMDRENVHAIPIAAVC